MIIYVWLVILFILLYSKFAKLKEGMDKCDNKTLVYKNTGTLKNIQESIKEIKTRLGKINTKIEKDTKKTNENTRRMKKLSDEISAQMKKKQKELSNISAK
jgi:peptidoglycan hydrolase CwlO-like protein